MKPPTISEDEESEASAEAGADASGGPMPETADQEVAEWVKAAMERKASGKVAKAETPALHAVPLDTVPGSPKSHSGDEVKNIPYQGVKLDRPELKHAQIESVDFASNLSDEASDRKTQSPSVEEIRNEETEGP